MTTQISRRAVGAVTAVLLAGTAVLAAPVAATAAEPVGDTVNYFDDAYATLDSDNVFETVTFERFEDLLTSDGTYAFLIGGPDDATTNAVIGVVDDVAATLGVDAVYNFNPKLDGATLDIRTTTNAHFGVLWPRLVDNYLSKDAETPFSKNTSAIDSNPYLFVYDKSGGETNRILAALSGTKSAEELADPIAAAAFRSQVSDVLDVAELDTRSQFEFQSKNINTRHSNSYTNAALYGGAILTEADTDYRLQSITYPELVNIFESEGDFVVFFGGTWCHNTRAVVKAANDFAVENNVKKVYFFDLRLDGASANDIHIRDSNSSFAHLYGQVVNQYLPNLVTQYVTNGTASQRVEYFPGGDTTQAKQIAKKLQVPYFIHYNKSHTESGQPAPVVREWIRANPNGSYTEYMTEWWWVLGLNGGSTNQTTIASNHAFAADGITKLDEFFTGFALDAEETAPAAPAAPTLTVSGSDLTVNWVAPADGGSPITGYEVSLNGLVPVSVAAPATSYVFPDLPAGSYKATVSAVNAIGTSPASAASASVLVPQEEDAEEEPVDPTTVKGVVTVSGDLRAGGTVTIKGSGFAESTEGFSVEIHSTPQLLETVSTNASGAFTVTTTIPASVPVGAHSIVVLIDGVEVGRTAISVGGALALALTGSDAAALTIGAILALTVLGAGAAFVVTGARRRSRTQ